MPIKNYLTSEQRTNLQGHLKKHEHQDVRERILIILLQNDGKTQKEIADFLGCSLRKVAYWCVHSDPNNLESFNDKRMSGNYRKATEQYVEKLLEVIDKEPQEFGYEFGKWTAIKTSYLLRTGDWYWVHLNFEENQELKAFWEWGMGNWEWLKKSFCQDEMLPKYLVAKTQKNGCISILKRAKNLTFFGNGEWGMGNGELVHRVFLQIWDAPLVFL